MKTAITILCGLAVATAAFAQPGPGQNGRGRGPHGPGPGSGAFPPPVMVILDADKDGVLSEIEINAAPGVLATLESNNDGVLTVEEICVGCPRPNQDGQGVCNGTGQGKGPGMGQGKGKGKGSMGGPGGAPFFLRLLDANQDGALSAQEVANASSALLALDKNADKQLTPDELRPQDGQGPRGPHGQGGQRKGR